MKNKHILSVLTLTILTGCGGSSHDDEKPPVEVEKVPELNAISVSSSPLIKASESQFSQNLKNGIFKRYQEQLPNSGQTEQDAVASPSLPKDFSQTNQQEQTVDEADRIKYNGELLFIAAHSANDIDNDSSQGEHYIRVMQRDVEGELNQIQTLPYSDSPWSDQQLYLHDNTLAIVDYSPSYFTSGTSEPAVIATSDVVNTSEPYFYYGGAEFELSFVDISQPGQAAIKHQFKIEGGLIDSRVIDNKLYLISNYHPHFNDFDTSNTDEDTVLENYKKLTAEQVAALTPNITDTENNTSAELVTPDNCYISSDTTDLDGFDSLITITKIDLTNPEQRESLCINTSVHGIYASENSLYTHGTFYRDGVDKTIIHKFNLSGETMNYAATGEIEGHLGWGQRNLRFSEFEGDLRAVTTTNLPFNQQAGFSPLKHQLFVLEQQDNKLVSIASLPNDTQPQPIGKTNAQGLVDEDIYAVRFAQDRAFIVTFRQVDPLYVIDLSDKTKPIIAGELEIPGYSAYLHPVNEHLLLGIGQNIQNWQDPSAQEVENGAKVTLFDISDISSPQVINEKVFANAYTPAEWDYKSLSFLNFDENLLRFTMPVEKWQSETNDDSLYQWRRGSELAAFEINTSDSSALNYLGSSKVNYENISADTQPYVWGGLDRAVIHSDDLYYIHGNYIWHSLWQTPSDNQGPL
ncbi:beta-propeller domain-containing protein [Pseudoalteromonas phenolica]|uniref:beta-propeller domain-containing protein n=1 Tax=Pseudoalteromonas phenolica TaxID=161398 RepID=UPI0013EEDAA4|nr:beta-propeller domain-containing protein [Pseudoalteromonas phenolica]